MAHSPKGSKNGVERGGFKKIFAAAAIFQAEFSIDPIFRTPQNALDAGMPLPLSSQIVPACFPSTVQYPTGLVIIDEVQRKPELFELIRVVVDRSDRNARFLLLESASPHLVKGVSESLAGSIGFVDLAGFEPWEVGAQHRDRLWLRGGLPDLSTLLKIRRGDISIFLLELTWFGCCGHGLKNSDFTSDLNRI